MKKQLEALKERLSKHAGSPLASPASPPEDVRVTPTSGGPDAPVNATGAAAHVNGSATGKAESKAPPAAGGGGGCCVVQ
jgi:hypothetical protein